jgi:hypothetical protein
MPTKRPTTPITRIDLREEFSDFRKDLRINFATKQDIAVFATKEDLQKASSMIIGEIDEKAGAILEAVGELHGDHIRHTQEAIIELAKKVDASDLKTIRKVQADLG